FIQAASGGSQVIIGEAGYSRAYWGESAVTRLEAAMRKALDMGVAYFICWNLNDQGPNADYGVFDSLDRLTKTGHLIEKLLRGTSRDAMVVRQIVNQYRDQSGPRTGFAIKW